MALMGALIQALDGLAADPDIKVVVIAGAGPAFCAGHDLKELRADPRRENLRGDVPALQRADAQDHPAAEAGDRARPRHRHRGRLPACRHLRSRGRRRTAARFATPGVNIGLFCSTPMVALSPRRVAQAGDGDAADRRDDRGRAGAGDRAHQPRRARGELDSAVAALAAVIAGKSPQSWPSARRRSTARRDLGLADAYAYASEVMTRNMMAARRRRRHRRLHRKAPADLAGPLSRTQSSP